MRCADRVLQEGNAKGAFWDGTQNVQDEAFRSLSAEVALAACSAVRPFPQGVSGSFVTSSRRVHGDAGRRCWRALEGRSTALIVRPTDALVREVQTLPVIQQAVTADANALKHHLLHKGWDDGEGRREGRPHR